MASFALIVNPISGRGKGRLRAAAFRAALSGRATLQVHETTGRGSATSLAASVGAAVDGVIAIGGDGTLNEVLNGLVRCRQERGRCAALGFLPAGTGNAASAALGIPKNPSEAARAVLEAAPVLIDIGLASSGPWERAFLLWLGAGLDAVLVGALHEKREGVMGVVGMLNRAPAVVGALARYPQPPIEVAVAGSSAGTFASIIVANFGRVPFGGAVTHRAAPTDAQLNLIGVPGASLPRALWRGRHMLSSALSEARDVQEHLVAGCELRSKGTVPMQVDGELVGVLPARVSCIPRGIRVLGSAL